MVCGKSSKAIPHPKVPSGHIPVVVEVQFTVEYLTTGAVSKKAIHIQLILFWELLERATSQEEWKHV